MQASNIFKLIFRFSIIKSVLLVSFAYIPPTLAAALITISGLFFSIVFLVCSIENRSVSCRVDGIISETLSETERIRFKDFPTKPLLPKIITFFYP